MNFIIYFFKLNLNLLKCLLLKSNKYFLATLLFERLFCTW